MREQKFRVWDDKLKKFWYGNIREIFGHLPTDVKDEHIQQFTGIKDKNGIPIFEGDILEHCFLKTTNDENSIHFGATLIGPVSYCTWRCAYTLTIFHDNVSRRHVGMIIR